jgi:membrane protein implicated in regulation of membrane protease activity
MLRVRGIAIIVGIILLLMAIGLGVVELIALPLGGVSIGAGVLYGVVLIIAVLGILALFGRRRQNRAKARAAAG